MVAPAQLSQRLWRVPASITLAQCILESGWGQSQLARRCNNYFGVKAIQGQDYVELPTVEVVEGRNVAELARFARYPSAIESFSAHGKLLATLPRYADAMRHTGDYAAFAAAIKVAGYSTNPAYALQLVDLVEYYELNKYDITPPDSPDAPAAKEAA